MRLLIVVVVLSARMASGDPLQPEVGIDAGIEWINFPRDSAGSQLTVFATAPYVGARIGARSNRFGFGIFANVVTFADRESTSVFCDSLTWDVRDTVFDFGARIEGRYREAFAALIVGVERFADHGTYTTVEPASEMSKIFTGYGSFEIWGPLVGMELGYTFRHHADCRCAVRFVASAQYAGFDTEHGLDLPHAIPTQSISFRLGIGVAFW